MSRHPYPPWIDDDKCDLDLKEDGMRDIIDHLDMRRINAAPDMSGKPRAVFINQNEVAQVVDIVRALRSRLAALEKVAEYAKHRNDAGCFCESLKHSDFSCTCGLDIALAEVKP